MGFNKISNIILLLLSLVVVSNDSISQVDKAITIELGGNGGFYSLNFENSLSSNNALGYRLGVSMLPLSNASGPVVTIPTLLQYSVDSKNKSYDFGIGQSFSIHSGIYSYITANLGYKRKMSKDFFIKASYTPLVSYLYRFQYQNHFGLTIGKKLNK